MRPGAQPDGRDRGPLASAHAAAYGGVPAGAYMAAVSGSPRRDLARTPAASLTPTPLVAPSSRALSKKIAMPPIADASSAVRRRYTEKPKTVLAFFATVLGIAVAGDIACVATLASTKQLEWAIPWLHAFAGGFTLRPTSPSTETHFRTPAHPAPACAPAAGLAIAARSGSPSLVGQILWGPRNHAAGNEPPS